ncbi:sugar phosphate isomerase/epimerase family protein [Vagococcus hydrophili]|uniref:Sugar phosphate isomerase/epimerase n=1 Tax=Vagococcus hydrophili TaxID=2714947 RepID=A0A6G8ATP2_9ENTE|nr:sugar phosphate isomerase/epimerase [Vagococcus hydrophili]QIL48339.1 sugar phosphate isomerase/epimerase [Vagococcus hydrophili]
MKKIVLNLLVFNQQFTEGEMQKELVIKGIGLGFNQIEVRREYFRDIKSELLEINQLVKNHNLELFYSVPEEVFVEGNINPKLTEYLLEAKEMGARHIKWNIGDFKNFTGDLNELEKLTGMGINVTIENDQTEISGKIQSIQEFMKAVTNKKLDIGYVYDLGNWRFVEEDERKAAQKLKEYVTYIHVKDVDMTTGKPVVAGLDQGEINWRDILEVLPTNVPVAIEYPTTKDEEIKRAKKLLEEV